MSHQAEGSVLVNTARLHDADPPARRSPLLDWLALALLLAVVVRLALRAAGPINDPDTWWHLRLGQEFRGAWSLSNPGQLTPFADRPWFATQWTLELLASYLEEFVGLAAISWLAGAGVVLLALATYRACRHRAGPLAAAMATAVALVGTALSHGPRPQLVTFILAAVVVSAWLKTSVDGKARWWLVPLSWLWAATHGMWFLGVAIGVLTLVGMKLDRRLDGAARMRLGLIPLLSVIVAGLTPVGPKLLLAPVATSQMAAFVTEWQPPDFTTVVPAIAALSIAVVVTSWARGTRQSWTELLLLAMAAGWILMYSRTVAVGAVLAAPLLAGVVQSWLPSDRLEAPKGERLVLPAALAGCLVLLAFVVPHNNPGTRYQPHALNSELNQLDAGTVIFNSYEVGGWLEWHHQGLSPVVDGMTDAYQVAHMQKYGNALSLKPGWEAFVEDTGASFALLESTTALALALQEIEGWRVLETTEDYVLLQSPSLG